MTKVLHLIRHGESEANRAGIYQGQTYDTPLTKMGVRQAKAVAKILPGVKADVIYTSPLKRTYETAVEIKKVTDLKLKVEDKLLEISHGDWEGKKPEEFDEKEITNEYKELFDSFINNYNNESLDEVDIIRIQLYNEIWYALYQEWDKISASYKAKQIPIERSRCRCWREFLLGLD